MILSGVNGTDCHSTGIADKSFTKAILHCI